MLINKRLGENNFCAYDYLYLEDHLRTQIMDQVLEPPEKLVGGPVHQRVI